MSDREELCQLLKESAILRSAPGQPIGGRDQSPALWMFYSWDVTMTERGARLAARCVLDRLRTFESTQLATFGYTAMPILSACLLLGEGRYSGLCVRENRKRHGSYRRVDGPADRSRPVVVLDDSVSSGTAMLSAIEGLEAEGFHVEGCISLVNFPWRGGVERLQALGYRVEPLFDIWRDLQMPITEFVPVHQRIMPASWGSRRIPDGLHPAHAARRAAEMYLEDGLFPTPPQSLDASYDARGGTFVSFRWRDTDIRLARDGFWHFDADAADPCRDVVLASVRTVQCARGAIDPRSVQDLKIAVTFFGPLEKVLPRQLDFPRYGIVVRSRAYEARMGGALPNTQVFISEYEQYRHARVTNAAIGRFEPHEIYRHTLTKFVEPGAYWLPYGAPRESREWKDDPDLGDRLARRAFAWVQALDGGGEPADEALPDELVPVPLFCVAVSLYHEGIVGCGLAWGGTLDDCLRRAARGALDDKRYAARRQGVPTDELDVSVSLLHDREWHGEVPAHKAAFKLRRGLDSISVQQGTKRAVFLPFVMSWFNWSKDETARMLQQKAGIRGDACTWSTFATASWLLRRNRTWPLQFGWPQRTADAAAQRHEHIRLLAGYILAHQDDNGFPDYMYRPVIDEVDRRGTPARCIHALWMLLEAADVTDDTAMRTRALHGLRWCASYLDDGGLALPGQSRSPLADCLLLLALSDSGDPALRDDRWRALGRRVTGWLQADGRITDSPQARGVDHDHGFMPGIVLLSLARFANAGGEADWLRTVQRHLHWYRRWFRLIQGWGVVGWQTRAWNALHALSQSPVTQVGSAENAPSDPALAEQADRVALVFELADFALDWQHDIEGWFITDLHPDGPSFHTAFIAEGMADAWALARRIGDEERARRYETSCLRATTFMDRLVIHEEDTFCTPAPTRALGGVRSGLAQSDVRIDYVSHTMGALIGACRNTSAVQTATSNT